MCFQSAISSGESGHTNLLNRVRELPGLTGGCLEGSFLLQSAFLNILSLVHLVSVRVS